MNRVEEMMDLMKAHDLRELKEFFNKKEEEQKKNNTLVWVFAITGIVAAVAGIAFLVYRYFTPDYLEDYDDDFDDDFEDDFFEEDDGDAEKKPAKQVSENAASEEDFAE